LKTISEEKRLAFIRKIVLFFLLIGIFLSFKLWTSDRIFPLLPVFDKIPLLIYPFDYLFIFSLILLLCINLFYWKNRINLFVIAILSVFFIQDQNRWQPWAYIYFMFLILFSFSGKSENKQRNLLFYFRIIIIGIYLWSGIHKLNSNFIDETFEMILTRFLSLQEEQLINSLKPLGYCIPLVEIAISIFLFLSKLRDIGVYLAIISHIFILLYLSPLGVNDNFVVYPWNIAMITIVFFAFYRTTDKLEILRNKPDLRTVLILFLIYIFPGLNFFNLWDNYLSFSLYSNKTDNYYIIIEETQLDKIDKRMVPYFLPIEGLKGGKIIDIGKWSAKELNVPFYPEKRTFKKVAKQFCRLGIRDDQLYFLELKSSEKGKYIRYTCKDI
jgi:hypothetical protein